MHSGRVARDMSDNFFSDLSVFLRVEITGDNKNNLYKKALECLETSINNSEFLISRELIITYRKIFDRFERCKVDSTITTDKGNNVSDLQAMLDKLKVLTKDGVNIKLKEMLVEQTTYKTDAIRLKSLKKIKKFIYKQPNNIRKELNVNVATDKGESLLHMAARVHYAKMVKFLIENGTAKGSCNNFNQTALHYYAASGGTKKRIAKALIGHGCNPNQEDDYLETPLSIAIRDGNYKLAKLFISVTSKEVKEYTTICRQTYLHQAAAAGNIEIMELLLKCGVALDAPDSNGNTARDVAQAKRWPNQCFA